MERIVKRIVQSRQAHKQKRQQCRVLAYSNAISSTNGRFSELSKEARSFLGLGNKKSQLPKQLTNSFVGKAMNTRRL